MNGSKPSMTDEELMKLAQKRVKARKDFLLHLSVYLIVNIVCVIVCLVSHSHEHGTTFKNFWPKWPIFCWGALVLFHGLAVLFHFGDSSNDKVMREYNRLKQSAGSGDAQNDNKKSD